MGSALALFITKLAPTILNLVASAVGALHDKQLLDAGDARAVSRALASAAQARGLAHVVEVEADLAHSRDSSDSAFDRDFQRRD